MGRDTKTCGNVRVEHHKTSNIVQITISEMEEVSQGNFKPCTKIIWLDTTQAEELLEALKIMNWE